MKLEILLLGALARFTTAQVNYGNATLVANDQCQAAVFDACPADGSAAHRCLSVPNENKGIYEDTCVSSCATDSPCVSRCANANLGGGWCGANNLCVCDGGWDTAFAAPPDPYDLSWVRKWAAIGDSYAAGIGAGSRYPDTSIHCARYDQSYPAFIQDHELMPQDPAAAFEYLACSGATSPEVLANQISKMGTGYDLITVSSGGNDVGLSAILNACVFQWNPFKNCENEMQATLEAIRNTLPGNLDKLYAGLADKINTGRKIYVTGYATFFDNTTTACDNTTWSFWYNFMNKQYLTTERRTLMNELTQATNAAIEDAVARAGPSFEFVGYDQYFTVLQGRYCEAGVKEPQGDRDGLLFYEWTSTDKSSTLLPRGMDESELFADEWGLIMAGDTSDPDPEKESMLTLRTETSKRTEEGILSSFGGDVVQPRQDGTDQEQPGVNQTVRGSIEQMLTEAMVQNNTLIVSLPDGSGADPVYRGRSSLTVSEILNDKVERVFHPQPGGHAIIANLVLFRMFEDNAAVIKADAIAPSEAAGCQVLTSSSRPNLPDTISGVNTNCKEVAQNCINCLDRAHGLATFDCVFEYRSGCNACGGGDGCPC
ncbi:kinetoplastid membrane protein 11 [Diaporthe helianthi]|uniref:Kinetoplastid membrane protein 11 n=1 Tax=Diaporthe helianthi TaxID=158607 RepID=A0A2P5HJF8_DIAHE|nr:kinetoplastid membrane protein 11 [Diaporthe helianthi]